MRVGPPTGSAVEKFHRDGSGQQPGFRLRKGRKSSQTEVNVDIKPTIRPKDPIEELCELDYQEAHDELDRKYLGRVMEMTNGKIQPAAKMIGIDRGTLRARLKELGLYSLG